MTESTSLAENGAIDQISFFRVDVKSGRFYRSYAKFIRLEDHALYIEVNSKILVISSEYKIRDMMLTDWLILGFVYKAPDDKFAALYPLPATPNFNLEALEVEYEDIDVSEAAYSSDQVIQKQKKLNNLVKQFSSVVDILKNEYQEDQAIAQKVLEKSVNISQYHSTSKAHTRRKSQEMPLTVLDDSRVMQNNSIIRTREIPNSSGALTNSGSNSTIPASSLILSEKDRKKVNQVLKKHKKDLSHFFR